MPKPNKLPKNGYHKIMKRKQKRGLTTKKGSRGERANFITKDECMRRLQLKELDFMRLCIFKGVHPRQPKKKFGDPSAIWYHLDDFKTLNNDELIDKFYTIRRFDKRLSRYIHRKELKKAKSYTDRFEPYYNLARVVKERYPTFQAAIKDALDDALNTLCVISRLPVDDVTEHISGQRVQEAQTLLDHFYYIVSKIGAIDKAFISMKGIFFGATIDNVPITWLIPHQAAIDTDAAVDFRLIDTYGEFYLVLLKFVVFRLFTQNNLEYPPTYRGGSRAPCGWLSLETKAIEKEDEQNKSDDERSPSGDQDDGVEEIEKLQDETVAAERKLRKTLFESVNAYINQEVPLTPVAMLLINGGANVGWYESPSDPEKYSNYDLFAPLITHHIIDRPKLPISAQTMKGRKFVQPQWVFDSLNANKIQSVASYEIGKPLPPHMSPFVAPMKTKEEIELEIQSEAAKEKDEERLLRMSMMTGKNRYTYRMLGLKEEEKKRARG